jgi:Tfp pilus assembly protein PilE
MQKEQITEVVLKNNKKQKGVTIVEYIIMLAIVAIAVALASPSIKNSVLEGFNRASSVMLQSY